MKERKLKAKANVIFLNFVLLLLQAHTQSLKQIYAETINYHTRYMMAAMATTARIEAVDESIAVAKR